MAVEIPVVIDIQAAFKTAAAQVPSAIRPLKDSIEKYSEDLMKWTEKMRTAKVDSPEFIKAAKSIQAISQALEVAEDRLLKFSTNPGSIKRLNGELAALERRWNEMGSKQKFDANGNLSADAQKLYENYKKMADEIAKSGKSLSQMYSDEKRLAAEQKKAADAAKAHQDALRAMTTTIQGLEASSAAWRKELNSIDFYKNPAIFAQAAANAEYFSRRLADVAAQAKIIGANSGSIDQLRARLQEVTTKYNALSESERTGAGGKGLLREYRDISKEIDKQAKDIGRIISEENRRAEIAAKVAQKRTNEGYILKTTVNTINVLTKKAEILQRQLNNTTIGSDQYKKLQQDLLEVNKQLDKARGGVNGLTTSMQRQSGVLRSLTSMASMYFSVFGLLRFAKQIRDVTGELEYQRVALGHLIQDEEYGAVLFEKIKDLAKESPFRIKELVTYTKQLAAYQIEEDKLFDTTSRLADISAGLGVDMNRLILAYGQVRAASVLRGQELRQFTEAGIPLVEKLAEKFSELNNKAVSTADVFELISKRAVPFSMISDIFEDMTNKGGMFYQMQMEQAKTLKGQWEKLKDAYDIALQSIGETKTFEVYNKAILSTLRFFADNLRIVPKAIEGMTLAWLSYSVATRIAGKATTTLAREQIKEAAALKATEISGKEAGFAHKRLTAALISEQVATNGLTRSLAKLRIAMWSNPWIALASIIAGAGLALLTFRKRNNEVTDSINDSRTALEKYRDTLSKYGEGGRSEKLEKTFNDLSGKTEKTESETRKLNNTVAELSELYPKLTKAIYDNRDAMKGAPEDIKTERESILAESKKELEDQLAVRQEERDRLQKEYEEQQKKASEFAQAVSLYREKLKTSSGELLGNRLWIDYAEQIDRLLPEWESAQEEADRTYKSIQNLNNIIADIDKVLNPVTKQTEAWKDEMKKLNSYSVELSTANIFAPEDIDNMQGLYDLYKKLKKEWQSAKTEADSLYEVYQKVTEPIRRAKLFQEYNDALNRFNQIEASRLFFGFDFKEKTTKKSDTRLSDLKKDISEITNAYKKFLELRKYMGEDAALNEMALLFPQFGGEKMNLENTLARLQKKRDDVAKKLAKSPKDKTLLEMQRTLDTEISNLRFDELKTKMEEELKRISDEMKRSETARNFFENILGLTGDRNLAENLTISVYGDVGSGFAERVHKELEAAFETFDTSDYSLWDQMRRAIENEDWDFILKNINGFSEKWRDELKKVADDTKKQSAELVKNFAEAWSKIDDSGIKADVIKRKTTKEIQDIVDAASEIMNTEGISDEDMAKVRHMRDRLIALLRGQEELDLFKLSDEYMSFFSEINTMTVEQATEVRSKLRDAYFKAFNTGAITADELRKNLKAVDEQFKKLTSTTSIFTSYLQGGLDGAISKVQEYADNIDVIAAKMQRGDTLSEGEKSYVTRMLQLFGKSSGGEQLKGISSYEQLISAFGKNGKGIEGAGKAFSAMGKGVSTMASKGGGAVAMVDAIVNAVNDTITAVQELIDELNRMRSEENKVGDWYRYIGDFNKYAYKGWNDLKSGNGIGVLVDIINSIVSIFNNVQMSKVNRLNDEIEEQSDILEDLDYSYQRVEKAMASAFGSDYVANYTKQLEILQAKQEAYLKQAEAERNKGKSADSDKIKEYENNARGVADQIEDMQSQLSEFFSGTDLTSAAKDFANAWIEAYKEYGNVTDAMKEKFNDMVQEMVENSVAAQVMQNLLRPIFEQIDALAKEGGELSMEDVAQIAKMATDAIPGINEAMTTLMNTLTASGYNVRQKVGQFTGISRNIANASEESINGLAQGVNTQNWYLSYVPGIHANVAAILEILNGGTGAVGTQVPSTVVANNELMMSYLSNLEPIKAAVLQMRDELHSVISSKYAETNTNVVGIRM